MHEYRVDQFLDGNNPPKLSGLLDRSLQLMIITDASIPTDANDD
jgi:hypothetical protein